MNEENITELFVLTVNQKRAASILNVDKFTIANYRRKLPSFGMQLEFLFKHNLIKVDKL